MSNIRQMERKEIFEFLHKMKKLQEIILDYLDYQDMVEENFQNLVQYVENEKIRENKNELKSILYLISNISANHNLCNHFYEKIERIILLFLEDIKIFSNFDIFNIFKNTKRILLFLFEEKILIPDKQISSIIISKKYQKRGYPSYFYPTFKDFYDIKTIKSKEFDLSYLFIFESNIITAEDNQYFCELIQNDSIEDFITYIKKTNLSLHTKIKISDFNTNLFLIKNSNKPPTLIEFSAFYGSIQIFQYLRLNNVELTSSLWLFAIHGNHPEIIRVLEENKIEPEDGNYSECIKESVKCHHNDITNYIKSNLFNEKDNFIDDFIGFRYFNFNYLCENIREMLDKNEFMTLFNVFCKYDYIYFVELLLNNQNVALNTDVSVNVHKTHDVKTPLYFAVENNNFEIVQLLLTSSKINVNCFSFVHDKKNKYTTNEDKVQWKTALHAAIENENLKIIEILLADPRIDVNAELCAKYVIPRISDKQFDYGIEKLTALHIAVENENVEIVELLLKNQKIDLNSKSLVHLYSEEMEGEMFENNGIERKTALHIAALKGNIKIVELLLKNPQIDVNAESLFDQEWGYKKCPGYEHFYEKKAALHIAVEKEYIEIINLLLKVRNINVNSLFRTSKYWLSDNSLDFLDYRFTKSALQIAVEQENAEIVELLLTREEIDINFLSFYDFWYSYDMKKMCKESNMLYTKHDVEEQNKNEEDVNCNPLCKQKNEQEKEIDSSVDDILVYFEDKYMKSAVHVAIEKENLKIIQILIKSRKVDFNLSEISSWSKFCKEFFNDNSTVMNLCETKTPLQIAIDIKNHDIIDILSDYDVNK